MWETGTCGQFDGHGDGINSCVSAVCITGSQSEGRAITPVLTPVLYQTNVASPRFVTMAASNIPRMYHSTANLLPVSPLLNLQVPWGEVFSKMCYEREYPRVFQELSQKRTLYEARRSKYHIHLVENINLLLVTHHCQNQNAAMCMEFVCHNNTRSRNFC